MDELDLLLKEACMKVAEIKVEQWESDTTDYTSAERFRAEDGRKFFVYKKRL